MASKELTSGWQSKCSEMKERGARLLASGRLADCWFAVGAGRASRAAHRVLLAMASPVFEAMLYGALAEGAEPVAVPDMEPHAFDLMLEYIYSDSVNVTSCDIARAVYYGAQKYILPDLKAKCIAFLSVHLDPDTVCPIYEFSQFVEEITLRNECIEMMQRKTLEVLEADSFLEVQEQTVAEMFALERLHIASELQLLAAGERWARARALGDPKAGDGAEAKPALRDAVRNLRFLTLKPEEFAAHPSVTTILTESEVLAILSNLTTKDSLVPMPKGFSTSRVCRHQISEVTTRMEINISTLDTLYSDTLIVGKYPWRVGFSNIACEHLEVVAECNWEEEDLQWSCRAEVEIQLLSHVPHLTSVTWKFNQLFDNESPRWLCDTFVSWDTLTAPKWGFVEDEIISMKVRIKLIPSRPKH